MKRSKEDGSDEQMDPDEDSNNEAICQREDGDGDGDGDDDDETPPVQCWDDAIVDFDPLIRDAKFLWQTYGGNKKTAKSFWVDGDAEPRCQIEATALQIADFHLQAVEYAGVEFWTQFRASDAPDLGLEFHFDKDESKAARENDWKHPVVGTATYLTTGGAPLVVFATASPEGGELRESNDNETDDVKDPPWECPRKKLKRDEVSDAVDPTLDDGPSHAWIVYPVKGRHVAFAGNFLHGVPKELIFGKPVDRLSFLVNIWLDHKPDAVSPLADDVVEKLNPTVKEIFVIEDDKGERSNPRECLVFNSPEPLENLQEHIHGDTAPLPVKSIREYIKKPGAPLPILVNYRTQQVGTGITK